MESGDPYWYYSTNYKYLGVSFSRNTKLPRRVSKRVGKTGVKCGHSCLIPYYSNAYQRTWHTKEAVQLSEGSYLHRNVCNCVAPIIH